MSNQDLAKVWEEKIEEANKYHDAWANLFMVKALEDYEEGFQVAEHTEAYVLNLFYSTIAVKTPTLKFTNPIFDVSPSAATVTEHQENAYEIAENIEDTLNTYVTDEKNNFPQEILSGIEDSWSRFGIWEVGYESTWIDNPKVKSPKVRSDYVPGVDKRRERSRRSDPELIPEQERIYCVNIPAEHFRVSTNDATELWQCDWVGYYDYVRVEDLLALPGLKNKEELSRRASLETTGEDDAEVKAKIEFGGSLDIVKIWKIWDLRAKRKYCFSGSVEFYNKPYEIFPFESLRFKRRKKTKGWYPLPVTFNWLSPQNEINETRNANRDHRRRFKRVYVANKQAFEDEAQETVQNVFINGEDGTVLWANRDGAIAPVPNADIGSSVPLAMQVTKDDFNIISGTSSEQRGESDRTTATQAVLTNQSAKIRDTSERMTVAAVIQRLGKKIQSFYQSKTVNAFSVQSPQKGQLLDNFSSVQKVREIDPIIDLGDSTFDYNLQLKISSISITAAEEDKTSMIEFLNLLNAYPQFSLSPTLIRELAFKVGYRNDKVIRELQQLAQLQMVGLQEQLGGQVGQGTAEPGNQQLLEQMSPPTGEQVRNQLNGQGVPI